MATDSPTVTNNGDFTVITYTYSGLDNGDDGAPIKAVTFPTKSVQVSGTFGTGGNVVIEGSNDGTTYASLSDTAGNALATITAAAIEDIAENTVYLRPRVSNGDGSTDLDVIITCLRPTDKRQ